MQLEHLKPFTDAIASFMKAVDYQDNFTTPLPIIKTDVAGQFALIPAIEKWLGWEEGSIKISPKNIPVGQLSGMIQRYENSAEIYYATQQKTCWKRFVVAKELCHLIIDELDYSNLLESFTAENVLHAVDSDAILYNVSCERGRSELMAHVLAPFLLTPCFQDSDFIDTDESDYEVAQRYRVPEKMIELRRASQPLNIKVQESYRAYAK